MYPNILAQISIPANLHSNNNTSLLARSNVPKKTTPTIDLVAIAQEDLADEAEGLPPRFGFPLDVNYSLNNAGMWETLPNGDRVWRLTIEANEAKSINLLYDDFYLPPTAHLFLYNSETGQTIGAFSHFNNKADHKFATGLIYGEETTLEYYEPRAVAGQGRITIGTVVHGYRYIPNPKDGKRAYEDSGNCNINTICAQGDDWRDEIKAVGLMVIAGTRWCSGALYGNTDMNCTANYVTANHCLDSFDAINNPTASTMSFIWRYESPNCANGGVGNDGPTNMTTVGAIVRANNGRPGSIIDSDLAVLELVENPVVANYDVYFLGWDAGSTSHASATGIHHPASDVKKISMENDPLTSTNYSDNTITATGTHWRVIDWDSGTTEGGSSGSPLMNSTTKRAIGHLSGGGAACGNDESDWYGQTRYSWDNNGNLDPRRRFKDWLDPGNTGTLAIDGYYPNNCPGLATCNDGLQNNGETGLDCGGPNCTPCPCETTLTLNITFDDYPEETSWVLTNSNNTVLASSNGYNGQGDGSNISVTDICGDLDCLTFTIYDTYSDGICCGFGTGSYELINDLDGSVVASGGEFDFAESTTFCIEGVAFKAKVVLGGPYNGTDMNTNLGALMPTTSPYGDGLTTSMAVINTYEIVDWVEVQLRSTSAPNHVILAKRSALLKKDGSVVDTDGFTCVSFPESIYAGITDGDYRVAIQHRNHLGVMTDTDYTLY